ARWGRGRSRGKTRSRERGAQQHRDQHHGAARETNGAPDCPGADGDGPCSIATVRDEHDGPTAVGAHGVVLWEQLYGGVQQEDGLRRIESRLETSVFVAPHSVPAFSGEVTERVFLVR